MANIFLTIKTDTSHELVIKKSRFICHLKKLPLKKKHVNLLAPLVKRIGKPIIIVLPI